jgi:hypothetical protein
MVMRNMRRGLELLFSHRVLRAVLLIGFGIAAPRALQHAHAALYDHRAGASEFVFGVQEALTSVGFVVGSFVTAHFAAG